MGQLEHFGFSFERGGAHSSRTMMLDELTTLLDSSDHMNVGREEYQRLIVEENCLGKSSIKTRNLSYRHLVDLYALDSSIALYRTLLFFWQRDPAARPLLALQCAYARDSIFRLSAPLILSAAVGSTISREAVESVIERSHPDRFSPATLKSTAQNINSTWTKSGHLIGRVRKIRDQACPTAGSVAYALLLGYLSGVRGQLLFETEYMKLQDCSIDRAVELAEAASRKGWIVFKRIGDVIEVQFGSLLTSQEMEWIHE